MVNSKQQSDRAKQSEQENQQANLAKDGLSVDQIMENDFPYDRSAIGLGDSSPSDGNVVQKKGGHDKDEDKPLQFKSEEEEPLQMKGGKDKDEDKPLQFKSEESAELEEEEPIQMKGGHDKEEDKPLQFKSEESAELEEEEPLQMKGGKDKDEDKPLQFKLGSGQNANGNQHSVGTPMPDDILAKMGRAFNADFSNVKIHTDSAKAAQVGALAYTQGNDIHFAPGQYEPGSIKGQELIGHELTHVVQQRNGDVKPTAQAKGLAVNNDASLEKEADVMGAKAARGQSASVGGKGNGIQKQDDGSGKHGELESSWTDHLEKEKWYMVADVAETMGLVSAARHMRHYLGNSGSPLNVDADSMLRDLPQLATRFRNEIALAKQEAQIRIANGEKNFTITGAKKNHYATKGQSSDWFFAIGGYTYWIDAKVNVTTGRDGNSTAEMSSKLNVFDRYNWDKGKSVTIAGIEVTDESLGRLHKVGLAQEYEVNGSSSENEIEWDVTDKEALKLEDIEIDEGRRDRRTDPTRGRR